MKMKTIIAVLLVLALLVPIASAENVAMGRYVEDDMPLPESTLGFGNDDKGNVVTYENVNGKIVRNVLTDGKWATEETNWDATVVPSNNLIMVKENAGRLLMAYYGGAEVDYTTRLAIASDEGTKKLELEQLYRDIHYMSSVDFAPDGGLIIGNSGGGLSCYDENTGELRYSIDGVDGQFITSGDRLFAISLRDQSIIRCDAATGENRDDLTGAPLTGYEEDFLAVDSDSLYLVNRTGIYRVAQNGSVWERMVSGELSSLQLPSNYISGMAIDASECVVLSFNDDANRLTRYRYDASVPAAPSKELRAYTLGQCDTLTQAATVFQKNNPDYLVSVTQLLSADAGATTDDVIRALNAEILAGDGPDILLLDGMPMDSYIEKGVLADLSEITASSGLLDNVKESFTGADGSVRAIPTTVIMPVLIGKPENLKGIKTISDLADLAASWTGESSAMGLRTMDGWFDVLTPTCFPSWFSDNGSLDTEKFAQFLSVIKSLYASCGTEFDELGNEYDIYVASMGAMRFPNRRLMKGRDGREFELIRVSDGRSCVYPMVMSGIALSVIELSLAEEFSGGFAPMPSQGGSVYAPIGLIGVNANSSQKDAALEFVRTILSEDVQSVELYQGFPVNSKALDNRISEEHDDYMVSTSSYDEETGMEMMISGQWPKAEIRNPVGELVRNAKVAYVPDETLIAMIREELKPFFEGQEDESTAVGRISARLRAYLAE